MNSDQEAFDALLRHHFPAFLHKAFSTVSGGALLQENWHQYAIAWQLELVRRGHVSRLILTLPPRNLKSIMCSVAWVAWMLGRDPSLQFVCVSYSADLARNLAHACRSIMESGWYRRAFPHTRIQKGYSGEMDFQTTAGGGRLSTGVGGPLTGRGGDFIIMDDPIKPEDAMSETVRTSLQNWYSNTLVSRLNDKENGKIILVMQRLHEEDLAGHLLETGDWNELSLPAMAEETRLFQLDDNRFHKFEAGTALHPEREGLARLNELRRTMGAATFAAQYQQSPVPVTGLHVKREWFKYYEGIPERQTGDRIIQSWDTASKDGPFNDYSVCVTALIRRRQVYVLDVFRKKLQFPDLKRKVISLAKQWEVNILLIEDAASGQQLIQLLRHDMPTGVPRPIKRKPEQDKRTRFAAQTPLIEAGELVLPKDAPWLADFQKELLGFPQVRHDDQVDALVQLLAWYSTQACRSYSAGPTHPSLVGKLFDGSGSEIYC